MSTDVKANDDFFLSLLGAYGFHRKEQRKSGFGVAWATLAIVASLLSIVIGSTTWFNILIGIVGAYFLLVNGENYSEHRSLAYLTAIGAFKRGKRLDGCPYDPRALD